MRATWFQGAGIDVTALDALHAAVAAAQSKADASMVRANSAMSKANTVEGTASTAATTASSAVSAATSAVQAAASLSDIVMRLDTAQATADGVHASLQASIDALQTRVKLIGLGYAQLTSLLALGGSIDVPITLSRSMGTTGYNVEVSSVPAATVTVKANSKTQTGLVLNVKAAGLALTIGTPLVVVAWT